MRRITLESFHRATYPRGIFGVPSFPAPGKGLGITPRPKLGFHEAALDQLRPADYARLRGALAAAPRVSFVANAKDCRTLVEAILGRDPAPQGLAA